MPDFILKISPVYTDLEGFTLQSPMTMMIRMGEHYLDLQYGTKAEA